MIETHELGRTFVERRRLFQRHAGEPVCALDGVSLRVAAGRCLALVGPNGAGKSTLLKILATIVAPTAGRAAVCGLDVERDPAGVRARVGYAGNADRSFFWPLTGMENLIFFAQLAGHSYAAARETSREMLARVGLSHAADSRVSGYSAGMRQRLGLARALSNQPQVLLLDEPTANLDAEYRETAIEIINGVVADGRTAVVATHDPGLVSATATDSVRLENGRVVEAEPAEAATRVVRYRVLFAADGGRPEMLEVQDLGDGHVLATTLSQAIEDGRDIVSVEKVKR